VSDVLYLAWRYLRFYWGKAGLLVASLALIVFLPAGLHVLVDQAATALTARAEATPLVIGARGSATDLTLSALYFKPPAGSSVPLSEATRVTETGLGVGIPLYLRFEAGGQRIVGTTLDYVSFRGLRLARGRWMGLVGECVLGAEAAESLGATEGQHLLSSAGSAFDVAGSFPLEMTVVGVLEPTGTPDDEAVFVDVKTTWTIAGFAHAHQDVSQARVGDPGVLAKDADGNVVASAAVLSYTRITPENAGSFHIHGDPGALPVDAVLVAPRSPKAGVLLQGRYQEQDADVQLVAPAQVIEELLATVFSVRDFVLLGSIGLGLATLMTASLVFALSIRLRRREIETIRKIGGSRQRLRGVLAAEILMIVLGGLAMAGGLTLVVSRLGDTLVRLIGS
jgi:putative ABC transport system permease protein